MNKKAQVTIFIIIAVVIVALVSLFFIFRNSFGTTRLSSSMEQVYTDFLNCIEEDTLLGADKLESQGGYIELPNFEAGSPYSPFSSQLDFLGNPIPYWNYVSGNNIQKEQIPSKSEIETQLEKFINKKIPSCALDSYYADGYSVYFDSPDAKVNIRDDNIEVNLNMDLTIEKGDETALVRNHRITAKSNLGKLYSNAIKVYDEEQKSLFLEDYAIDTLRLYAPVDGVELSCSPKIWNAEDVFNDLQDAIELNTLALKSSGSNNDYFKVDLPFSEDVRFITSKNWANTIEVNPSEDAIMISNPVGTQAGLGILGFCYVPYHFVYNVKYPVLVQVYDGDETFQFPVTVIIEGNNPRESLEATSIQSKDTEFCNNKDTMIDIDVVDSNLNEVNAEISYECAGSTCYIGNTTGGSLQAEFPKCVNGYVVTRANGFEDSKYLYSTVTSGSVTVPVRKIYSKKVQLNLNNIPYNGDAIINFVSDSVSKTVVYPGQKTVEISEGDYNVSVYLYKDSSIQVKSSSYQQCIDVPNTGVSGIFGGTSQKCFDINVPPQIVSSALAGGGQDIYYMAESELQNSNTIEISAETLPEPDSLEQLQENYVLFETKGLGIKLK